MNKNMQSKSAHILLSAVGYLLLALPVAHAATLSIDPPAGHFGPGDTFVLTVRLDTLVDECVNAASVVVNYPTDWMKASAVSKGESLLTLWPEEPSIDLAKGVVRFDGGIPAGYCGRVQGDPGKTNILAKIVFTIPGNMIGGKTTTGSEHLAVTFAPDTKVLLNDGFGTAAPLTLVSGAYVRELTSLGLKNEWTDIVHEDTVPPELFRVELEHDANTYQGKYFIVFATVDKQSGVHHYEVSEDDPEQFGFVRGKKYEKALFTTTKSPYVLADQELKSRVIVRAFDHAGNVSEAILSPQNGVKSALNPAPGGGNVYRFWFTLLGATILAAAFLWYWLRCFKTRGSKSKHESING